jgi:hypothetical protein
VVQPDQQGRRAELRTEGEVLVGADEPGAALGVTCDYGVVKGSRYSDIYAAVLPNEQDLAVSGYEPQRVLRSGGDACYLAPLYIHWHTMNPHSRVHSKDPTRHVQRDHLSLRPRVGWAPFEKQQSGWQSGRIGVDDRDFGSRGVRDVTDVHDRRLHRLGGPRVRYGYGSSIGFRRP